MKNLALVLGMMMMTSFASAAHADTSYSCDGGEGDVSFTVSAKGELTISNSECSVDMILKSKAAKFSAFKGVRNDSSDVDLCGSSSVVSTAVLTGGSPVSLKLQGGESAGNYTCKLDK